MQLSGARALVTGGTSTIGKAICQALAKQHCRVGVHYHESKAKAFELAGELAGELEQLDTPATPIRGDLSQPDQWREIIRETHKQLGGLDLLINNAATFHDTGTDDLANFDPERWHQTLTLNLTAPVGLVSHAEPYLRSARGAVINILDVAAIHPWAGHLAYSASKAGLAAMTKALAKSLAPGVSVLGIAPGITSFPESMDSEAQERLLAKIPMGRLVLAEEIARVVVSMLEVGDYITGEIIHVDGGRHLSG